MADLEDYLAAPMLLPLWQAGSALVGACFISDHVKEWDLRAIQVGEPFQTFSHSNF